MKSIKAKGLLFSLLSFGLLLMPSHVFAEEITTNNEQIISNETNTNDPLDKTLESSELNVETSNLLVNDEKDVHNINQEDNEIMEEVPAKLTSFTIEESGYIGTDYILSSSGNSVNGVEYKYHLKDYETNKWTVLQDYSEVSNHTWMPQKTGKYRIVVHVRDKNSSKEYEAYTYKDIEVRDTEITKFSINDGKYLGQEYKIETLGGSTNGVDYKYLLKDYETNKWTVLQDYSDVNNYTWVPQKTGKYRLVVHVRDKNSSKEYDAYIYRDMEVKEVPPAKLTSFTIKEGGYVGTNYSLSSSGNSVNGAEYRYHLKDYETNKWTVLQDYSDVNNYTWVPQKTGKYRLVVHVRDKNSSKEYEAYTYKDIEVRNTEITKFNINEGMYIGQEYKIETLGGSANGVDYKYHLKDYETNKWTVLQDYSDVNNYTWVPQKTGKYRLVVHVRDKNSSKEYEAYTYKDIEVRNTEITKFNINEGMYIGQEYKIETFGGSANGVDYKYHLKDYSTGDWTVLQDYSDTNNYTWVPKKVSKYRIVVHVRDKNSSKEFEAFAYKDVTVKAKNKTIYLDPGHGGNDSGAYYSGTAERDLNLTIANKVASQLRNQGYNVVMSRTTNNSSANNDIFERAARANAAGVDIYVSIHHNAMPGNSSVSGIETYYYISKSQYPPLPENASSHNDPTRLSNSRKLAESIQSKLIKATGVNNRGVKRGSYVVLRETKMPAVLLELGFMSNPTELGRIKSDSYQNTLASAIVRGINDYFVK